MRVGQVRVGPRRVEMADLGDLVLVSEWTRGRHAGAVGGDVVRLVGQEPVVDILRDAVASAGGDGRSMTHAWLFTGPPGSG